MLDGVCFLPISLSQYESLYQLWQQQQRSFRSSLHFPPTLLASLLPSARMHRHQCAGLANTKRERTTFVTGENLELFRLQRKRESVHIPGRDIALACLVNREFDNYSAIDRIQASPTTVHIPKSSYYRTFHRTYKPRALALVCIRFRMNATSCLIQICFGV